MAKSSGDTLALTDYFHSPNKAKRRQTASSSTNSRPSQPLLKRTKLAKSTQGQNGTAQISGKEENLGQVTLSDSDDDDPKDRSNSQDSGDDLVIIEPTPSTSKVKLESDSNRLPPPPPEKIASIFTPRRRPSASTSPQKSVASTTTPVKAEVHDSLQLDKKPDIMPSPSKSIAIFDTAAATSGSAANATGSSSAAANPNLPLDTSLFSFHPSTDVSFSPHARVPFSFFTDALVLISSTKSRLYIQLVLTNLLRTVIEHDPASLLSVIYLCSNRIGPSYEPQTELGIGWRELRPVQAEPSPRRLPELTPQTPRFHRGAVQIDQRDFGCYAAEAQAARQQVWRPGRYRFRRFQECPTPRSAGAIALPQRVRDLVADCEAEGVRSASEG